MAATRWIGAGFPWGTLIVNVAGCFTVGAAMAFFAARTFPAPELRAFFTVSVLGGLYGAFSAEFAQLMENGAVAPAIFYLLASVFLSLAGAVTFLQHDSEFFSGHVFSSSREGAVLSLCAIRLASEISGDRLGEEG